LLTAREAIRLRQVNLLATIQQEAQVFSGLFQEELFRSVPLLLLETDLDLQCKNVLCWLWRRIMTPTDGRGSEKILDKKLAGMATKEDLAKLMAQMDTQEDLAKLESGIRHVLEEGIIAQPDMLLARMGDLSEAIERMGRRLEAVANHLERQDGALKRHGKRLADHEQRLGILEDSAA
jgi:hypothetical protein